MTETPTNELRLVNRNCSPSEVSEELFMKVLQQKWFIQLDRQEGYCNIEWRDVPVVEE